MSHVAMATAICEVCGKKYETGEILLHKNLRDIPPEKTITGMGLCPEHEKLDNDGFLALVEADPAKSKALPNGNLSHEGAFRTGRCMHIKREAAARVFNVNLDPKQKMVYIDIEAFDKIAAMAPPQG